jgi:hypothetical protein
MKSALRRRVSASVPFILTYENEDGTKFSDSFRLCYDFNKLALVEEILGKSVLLDIGEILDNPSVKNVSVLLWAAVLENHPEYEGAEGLETIRYNLTTWTAKEALTACTDAFMKQLPLEQQQRLKDIQEKRAAGEKTPPLAPSPETPATT